MGEVKGDLEVHLALAHVKHTAPGLISLFIATVL